MAERFFIDQMGFEVGVPQNPFKVISLVPSQTELLYDLGCADIIVGITKFCIHPSELAKSTQIIGGTKNFNFKLIQQLKPDLIIGNKEENYREGIDQLKEKYPVWMSDISNLTDAMEMIKSIGQLVNKENEADKLVNNIDHGFQSLASFKSISALYFIWNNPMMVAGQKTFIDEMLHFAGFKNLVANERYPILTDEEIRNMNPEVILLSSEPFPFTEKHVKLYESKFKSARVLIVNGEMFSWYGSRLLKTVDYIAQLRTEVIPTSSRSSQK